MAATWWFLRCARCHALVFRRTRADRPRCGVCLMPLAVNEFTVTAGTPLAEVERQYILWVLARAGGNTTRAAVALDISARTLRDKLRRYQKSF